MKKILTILATLCTALSGLLQWRRSRHREALSEAIHSGDTETVTKHHHHLLKVLAVSGILVVTAHCGGGCTREKLVIVNEPMAPVRLYYEGTPGWWLSDTLYEATLLKLEETR